MLRAVAGLLAVEIGQYAFADCIDARGVLRRVDIVHADPYRAVCLRVLCERTTFDPAGRVPRLLEQADCELVAAVSAARRKAMADVLLPAGERVTSYMAASVAVNGAPLAVLTLVRTHGTRRYGPDDLALLEEVADWTGLGMENALRREPTTRTTLVPASVETPLPSLRRAAAHRA